MQEQLSLFEDMARMVRFILGDVIRGIGTKDWHDRTYFLKISLAALKRISFRGHNVEAGIPLSSHPQKG